MIVQFDFHLSSRLAILNFKDSSDVFHFLMILNEIIRYRLHSGTSCHAFCKSSQSGGVATLSPQVCQRVKSVAHMPSHESEMKYKVMAKFRRNVATLNEKRFDGSRKCNHDCGGVSK